MADTNRHGDMAFPTAAGVSPLPLADTTGNGKDITRRQEAMVALGRRAVAPPALPILLQDAATLLAEMFDTEYSGVAEALTDQDMLRHHLACRDKQGKPAKQDTLETSLDATRSLAGYAIAMAHPVVVANLPSERRFTDALLRRRGVQSAIATPLTLQGEAFGALGAYSTRPEHFCRDDILFMETIGHLIATTVGRCRAEEALLAERRLSEGVLHAIEALVFVLDSQWRVVHTNRACQETTGFASREITGRPIWDVFTAPEGTSLFRTLRERFRESDVPIEYESYIETKHGDRRRIAWRYQWVGEEYDRPGRIIVTGIDITERCAAQQELCATQREVARAKEEIAELKQAGSEPLEGPPTPDGATTATAPFSALANPLNAERRQRPRRSYPYAQRIAPVVKGQLPTEEDFQQIECNDIAAGGFSFFTLVPPSSDSLIVALGTAPKITYLTAQVAHMTRLTRNGRRLYLVGCSYTGRIPC